ncbi:MAG: autotransporter outer membrane beta-barrel domain-containing protein, partial [Pseudomonadota bacterium]
DSSAGEVSGGTYGVYASNNGSGALSITTANVDGAQNAGIYATNAGTDLDIDTSAGAVSGETYGIYAFNNGTGSMEVTTGDVTGNQGAGVYAVNNGNGLDLDTSGGAVSGGTYGVYAFNQAGDMNITTGDVSGAQNGGVSAVNRGGDMNVDTSAGAVSGETYGISAFQRGTGALNITTGDVEGRQSAGIIAQVAGPVPINATLNGDTAGATIGMDVTAFGSDVSVTNNGALSGGDFAFRSADADTGDVTFDNNGAVNGAVRFGTGDDSLTNEGTVQGDIAFRDGANVLTNNDTVNGAVSFGSGDDTVTNTGTLTGDLALGSGINSVSNTGSITGSVTSGAGADSFTNDGAFASDGSDFGDGDDTFANNGTFDASGDVGFGGGADSFDNAGDLNVDGAVAFSGLETLTSGGSIAMNNGTAGDTLTTSGDFVGAGGTLDLDVDFGSNTADQLIVEGAATGTTEIRITDVGLTGAQGQPLVLVDGGAGTSETAFALAGDQAVFTPFISQGLSFDAANNDVLLSNTVSSRVFEAAALAETAQSLWYRSADAWADQRASERGDDSSRGVWAVAYGGTVDRENDYQDQTGQGIGNATLDYDQDYIGIQAGIDLVSDETVGIGLTAGYLNSNSTLDASSVETEFDVYNVGGYASYQRGGLSAEALIKYDSISGRVSDPIAAGYNGDLDGEAYGARLALAYRTAGAVYVEPHVSIEWQQTDLDSLAIDGQVFDFGSIDGLRGIAGVRVGGNFGSSGAMNFGYYAGASAVHEFEGDGNVRFSVGSDGTTFANDPIGTYALIEGGVTVDGEGPLSALIHLESELSGDYTGFGGKIGGKIRF